MFFDTLWVYLFLAIYANKDAYVSEKVKSITAPDSQTRRKAPDGVHRAANNVFSRRLNVCTVSQRCWQTAEIVDLGFSSRSDAAPPPPQGQFEHEPRCQIYAAPC